MVTITSTGTSLHQINYGLKFVFFPLPNEHSIKITNYTRRIKNYLVFKSTY
jgi:hypothetical protein